MLQWSCAGNGAPFCLYVRHTDAPSEWDYDVGAMRKLEEGLQDAAAKGWTVVDMKKDWKIIFPARKKARARDRAATGRITCTACKISHLPFY